jgi:hypothetical protein
MADYLDIMPRPPLGEEEKRVLESLSAMVKKFVNEHEITFVTPKAGAPIGELVWMFGAGEREGRSNVMMFEILKARNAGKTVVYFDYEASFSPDQLKAIGVDLAEPR